MQKSPFKFLDSYSKEDHDIFFGRDKEIGELYSRVFQSRILVVYGISGTGKSSLINCGLANKFNDADWLPVSIRRGMNINQNLAESLQRSAITPSSSGTLKTNIIKLIRSVYLDHFKPVFLIFDQFEEMFIFGSRQEKEEFIDTVRKILNSDLQCRIIFSVREEYLAGFTEFERTIPDFLSNRIRIEKMTRQNAVRVIEGPCEISGIEVEKGVSEYLLEKLNPDSPDVELTYLQVFLDKVFRTTSPESGIIRNLTREDVDRTGDVKDLLGAFLEEQISRLDDPEKGLIILKSFVSVRGTRNQITEEEVIGYSRTLGEEIEPSLAKSLIQKFISLRILRDKDENGRYELRHDSLAATIYEKITLVEKELLEIRQFIENSWRNYERRDLYLTAEDLKYIAPYEDKLFLNEKLLRFISQSKWAIHKAKRRRQNALIATGLIIIGILSFFTVWALRERRNALDQKQLADELKNSALFAKAEADSARQEALISKNLALENEAIAIGEKKKSDEARRQALSDREYALEQKSRAEILSVTANEQAEIANIEKLKAEDEKSKAVAAEGKARQLGLLSTAQNLALRSLNIEKDPQKIGILAAQAYNFNKENGGYPDDPVIFEALSNAWVLLDSSKHSLFTGSHNEIRSITEKNSILVTADLDGLIADWDNVGKITARSNLEITCPLNSIKISPDGAFILTQHDNSDIFLWKSGLSGHSLADRQKLNTGSGFFRNASFSEGNSFLALGGPGNKIDIWNISTAPIVICKSLSTEFPVNAVIFCGSDSLIFSQDDGSISFRNLKDEKNVNVYSSKTVKPVCLSWNPELKVLFAGCSDGSLLTFKWKDESFQAPVRFPGHAAGIEIISLSADYSLLATSGRDNTIRLYNYSEFFEKDNSIRGVVHIRNLNGRIRSMTFSEDNKLIAGLSDRSIRVWQTSSEKLVNDICSLITRDLTPLEWNDIAGNDIPYENCCKTLTGK